MTNPQALDPRIRGILAKKGNDYVKQGCNLQGAVILQLSISITEILLDEEPVFLV